LEGILILLWAIFGDSLPLTDGVSTDFLQHFSASERWNLMTITWKSSRMVENNSAFVRKVRFVYGSDIIYQDGGPHLGGGV